MSETPQNSKAKTTLVWVLLITVFALLFTLTRDPDLRYEEFDTFAADVEAGQVSGVRIDSNEISVSRWDGDDYRTLGLVDDAMTETLSRSGIIMAWGEAENPLRSFLLIGVPLLALLVLFFYFLKKGAAGGMGSVLDIKRSRAKLMEEVTVSFADVGGCEEAKEALGDVIDFLKNPERWTDAGVRLPRGVLLEGPPGCGKTLLARAVAGETDAKFYSVSASEFIEMFVGVGAARVRDMFEEAAKNSPAVVFIDELDAVGRRRGSGIGASHDEREQTLNQILVCMDGFENQANVVVIAATNRSDVLDEALLRPGRFDRRVKVPLLGRDQRIEVLGIHTGNKKLADGVSLDELADRTEGFTGAQLESLVNEAGLLAVRRARQQGENEIAVDADDFMQALVPRAAEQESFSVVDALLVESTTQLARAKGRGLVRIEQAEGGTVTGELLWADAMFLKLRDAEGRSTVLSKALVKSLEVLDGTEQSADGDVTPDRTLAVLPGTI
jgi:cell division protease FtsH